MSDSGEKPACESGGQRLSAVAALFLKLGFTAFGGPAAHVSMMEDEVVGRRKWMTRGEFLDMVSAVNFIPGPNSTELAIHVGQQRAGTAGLLTAGACFILPAMLIVLPLAWAYTTYGMSSPAPAVVGALAGIKAATVAVVAAALVRFARTGIKDRFTAVVAGLSLAAAAATSIWPVPQAELIILAAAATAGVLYYRKSGTPEDTDATRADETTAAQAAPSKSKARLLPLPLLAVSGPVAGQYVSMCLFFLEVGATLFGSGYVLASFLRAGLVEGHGWLTEQELLDAIAVGQVTPGPLLTAATFIGYVLGHRNFGGGVPGGIVGGVLATAAIFLPSFVFVAAFGKLLPTLRARRWARGALDGMNAAVVALIATVTVWLGKSAIVLPAGGINYLSTAIMLASLVVLLRTRVNATWVIAAAGLIGAMAVVF